MVERFNRRLAEALRALPSIRNTIRTGKKFATLADRTTILQAFIEDDNRTRLRCLAYFSPRQAVNNLTQENT